MFLAKKPNVHPLLSLQDERRIEFLYVMEWTLIEPCPLNQLGVPLPASPVMIHHAKGQTCANLSLFIQHKPVSIHSS